jgi:BirA family biotin operon repressor/biotin-[acetyl-CoA-carboxylase] ligase
VTGAFTDADLRAALGACALGAEMRVFAEIDSTSTEARRIVERGEARHGMVVVAHRQAAGRGTGGKVWHSHGPVGLWSTTILTGAVVHPISLMVGCAVADAIGDATGGAIAAHLKWPNDVMIGEGAAARKVSGILVETAFAPGIAEPAHLVGIGINVAQESFDGELRDRAVSLRMAGVETTVPVVFGALMRALDRHLRDPEPVAHRWVARTRMIDTSAEVRRSGEARRVMVRGVTAEGRLVVEEESTKLKAESGNPEGKGGERIFLAAASDMDLVWPVVPGA